MFDSENKEKFNLWSYIKDNFINTSKEKWLKIGYDVL